MDCKSITVSGLEDGERPLTSENTRRDFSDSLRISITDKLETRPHDGETFYNVLPPVQTVSGGWFEARLRYSIVLLSLWCRQQPQV